MTSAKDDQTEVYYDMDIKPNEAIACMFGSYGVKTDEKKNITAVWKASEWNLSRTLWRK